MKFTEGMLRSIYTWEEGEEDTISLKDLSVNLKNASVKDTTKAMNPNLQQIPVFERDDDNKESRSNIVSTTVKQEPVNNENEWRMCAIAPLQCYQEQEESRSNIVSTTVKQEPVHNENELSCAIAPLQCNQEQEESRSNIVSTTVKQEPVNNENELSCAIALLQCNQEQEESRSNIVSPTVKQEPVNNENVSIMCATAHSSYTWEEEDTISLKDLSVKLKKGKDKIKAPNPNLQQLPALERGEYDKESTSTILSATVKQEPVNNENVPSMCATAPLQCNQEHDESEGFSTTLTERADNEVAKTFLCEICNKGFLKDSALKAHLETHSEDAQFPCDICKAKFPQKYELKIHRYTHDKVKTYTCDMCGKVFLQSFLLENHISTHLEYKAFQCKKCPKQFVTMGNLKIHILMHSKDKPFSCSLCDKTFAQKGNMKTHLLTHSGSQPYECNICHKKFTQRGNLQHHLLTHTDNKPFSCELCGKSFAQKGNLKKHRLTNHSTIIPTYKTSTIIPRLRRRKSKTL